jgi:hypothetical protein
MKNEYIEKKIAQLEIAFTADDTTELFCIIDNIYSESRDRLTYDEWHDIGLQKGFNK